MTDLLKKLNVLLKSTLHDALSDHSSDQPPTPTKIGKEMGREVGHLRQRINDALAFEDELQQRAQSLKGEIDKWDRQADEAVMAGNDVNARYAIDQMQRAQQRLTVAEADLREHRLVTQELITRVNALDAAAADARRSESNTSPKQGGETVQPIGALAEKLDYMREKLNRATALTQVGAAQQSDQPTADDGRVEDDLARRRQRLSKPE